MHDPLLVSDALAVIAAHGDAAEEAARRPYRAARYDDVSRARVPRSPGPSVPLDLAALDTAREARMVVTAVLAEHRRRAGRRMLATSSASLGTVAAHLASVLDPAAAWLGSPPPPGSYMADIIDVSWAESLAAVAHPLPRVGAPRASTPPPSPESLPPSRRGLLVTAAEGEALLRAMDIVVPASTIRRWGSDGSMASVVADSGTRRYRVGDLLDRAEHRCGSATHAPESTAPEALAPVVMVDGREMAAAALRAALGLDPYPTHPEAVTRPHSAAQGHETGGDDDDDDGTERASGYDVGVP